MLMNLTMMSARPTRCLHFQSMTNDVAVVAVVAVVVDVVDVVDVVVVVDVDDDDDDDTINQN
jgi:hypothetical protein